jgi:hypothetical protein
VVGCWGWGGDDGTAFLGVSCVIGSRMAKGKVHWVALGLGGFGSGPQVLGSI